MKINKVYLIVILFSLLFSCSMQEEENILKINQNNGIELENTGKIDQNDRTELDKKCLFERSITSIVHSCGGGCAFSYSEKNVSIVDSLIKVEYEALMYMNEQIDGEFSGSFFISCNRLAKATYVFFENELDDNILEKNVNSISTSFQMYSDELCSCLNQKPEKIIQANKERTDEPKDKSQSYTCKEIEVENSYVDTLYRVCECNNDFDVCYSLFYLQMKEYYEGILPEILPNNDTLFFHEESKTEFKFYNSDSLKVSVIEEGGEVFLFKKNNSNSTTIEYYSYPP